MRWSIAVMCMLFACSQKKKQEPVGTGSESSPPLAQVKREVSQKPLPGLASDTGGATGTPQWLWTLGGIDSDGANAVVGTPDGGWVIGGSYTDAITIGATTIKAKGQTDALLVKLAPTGDIEWIKSFGGRYKDTILWVQC